MILLKAEGLNLTLNNRRLLEEVSFQLKNREFVTIIGPNGAGKTTLLRIILGLLKPSQGIIWRKPNLRIGYMPQKITIDPSLPITVERFLTLNASKSQAIKILKEVGASSLLSASLHNLSGGEFQRVLFAKALLTNPELLVLDEPLQGIDVVGQSELYQLITHLRKERGCTILLVSHDLHFVHSASDRVICLNHHICCAGHPLEVQKKPEYRALFGTIVPPGLVPYTHDHDHTHDHIHEENH
ncbi:metal ABC transporter ATP-binding protein [Candidatus Nucleicultrix amoebiphila]|jgi:zinc transport system ATP-binding protein|uniref:metal ABC transporter ATP-binding protein n=1 Tax=Candidatus Nucleicultrix amoebiphila TaxID=1509244 RepID=UPI000A268A74|nr:metal ABC transporter ATP-binding protein [Candidatus Nucleicultrix amoebiphila]